MHYSRECAKYTYNKGDILAKKTVKSYNLSNYQKLGGVANSVDGLERGRETEETRMCFCFEPESEGSHAS